MHIVRQLYPEAAHHKSLNNHSTNTTPTNSREDLQIYFNQQKRKMHFHKIIDEYFPTQITHNSFQKSINFVSIGPLHRHNAFSSKSTRTKYHQNQHYLKPKPHTKSISINVKEANDNPGLSIIEEGLLKTRPLSENKRTRMNFSEREMEQSLYQNKSGHEMSNRPLQPANSHTVSTKISLSKKLELEDLAFNFKYSLTRKSKNKIQRIKHFKSEDDEKLVRQGRAKRLGVQVLWRAGVDRRNLQYPLVKCLKELCCSIIEEKNSCESTTLIYPTQYYLDLFANDNEQLKDIVVSLARGIKSSSNYLANCQISLSKVVKLSEKQFHPIDWGCSASKQEIEIQGRKISNIMRPLLKQNDNWLLIPEYLAPEMLRAHIRDSYDELWDQKGGISSCDIWSLGCLIYELLALVPMSTTNFCMVKGRSSKKRGVLGCRVRSAQNILIKQRNLKGFGMRMLRQELKEQKQVMVSSKILDLVGLMLQENVEKRVSAQDIIRTLS